MSLKIVVLAKQVPDTRNVGKDAMTAEGTVNRAALPAIFNPEDMNALEQALRLKEQNPGSTVGILTMGPPRAGQIIREGLYRGADTGWLLTDRLFAGADTLATSYALATAIRKIGDVDLVIGGRQAIDGDTAQVGPQVAQKLGLNQITYAEEILDCKDGKITVRRHIDGGVETVEAPLPCVITVNGSAAPCRPANARLTMKYKRAACPLERSSEDRYASLSYSTSLRGASVPQSQPVERGRCGRRSIPVRSCRFSYQGEGRAEHRIPGQGKQDAHFLRCRHRRSRHGVVERQNHRITQGSEHEQRICILRNRGYQGC